jgi:thioredoxin 1
MSVKELSDSEFQEEVIHSKLPVLIDFWAAWCGPCRAIAPVVEELADEWNGKVKVLKMNVDENPDTPSHLGIRSIPTLKLFVGGAEKNQIVGAVSKEQLSRFIQDNIS